MKPEQEIQELRTLLAERDAQLAERDAELTAARREAVELRARLEAAEDGAVRLERELAKLRRELAGPSSERLDPNRLVPPEPPESSAPPANEPAAGTPKADEDPKKGKKGKLTWKNRTRNVRRDIAAMDELETVVHESRVEARRCPCGCGSSPPRRRSAWRCRSRAA